MKDTICLRKSIANGLFPAMCLWCSASSKLMMDLELADLLTMNLGLTGPLTMDLGLADPASLPSSTDYQTFVIPSLPSETLPAERIEEDPEDNIELCNELGILDHLEMRMQVLDGPDEEDQDDQSPGSVSAPSPSPPTVSRSPSRPEAIEGYSHKLAGPIHTCPNNVHSDDESLRQYWEENPCPTSLLPI